MSLFKNSTIKRTLSTYLVYVGLLLPVVHITHFDNPALRQDTLTGNVAIRRSLEQEHEVLDESTVLQTIWVWEDNHQKEGL